MEKGRQRRRSCEAGNEQQQQQQQLKRNRRPQPKYNSTQFCCCRRFFPASLGFEFDNVQKLSTNFNMDFFFLCFRIVLSLSHYSGNEFQRIVGKNVWHSFFIRTYSSYNTISTH